MNRTRTRTHVNTRTLNCRHVMSLCADFVFAGRRLYNIGRVLGEFQVGVIKHATDLALLNPVRREWLTGELSSSAGSPRCCSVATSTWPCCEPILPRSHAPGVHKRLDNVTVLPVPDSSWINGSGSCWQCITAPICNSFRSDSPVMHIVRHITVYIVVGGICRSAMLASIVVKV